MSEDDNDDAQRLTYDGVTQSVRTRGEAAADGVEVSDLITIPDPDDTTDFDQVEADALVNIDLILHRGARRIILDENELDIATCSFTLVAILTMFRRGFSLPMIEAMFERPHVFRVAYNIETRATTLSVDFEDKPDGGFMIDLTEDGPAVIRGGASGGQS